MALVSWQKAALNAIGSALGKPPEGLDLSGLSPEVLQRTKIEPLIASAACVGTAEPYAHGYFDEAWRLQRKAFEETLNVLCEAGLPVTTFKGAELVARYSNSTPIGLMADADIVVPHNYIVEAMSLLYQMGLKPGAVDYETGAFQPFAITDIGQVEAQHFQLPPFLITQEVELSPESFAFAEAHGRRPLKVIKGKAVLIYEIDVHFRTTMDIEFETFVPHLIDSIFLGAQTLSPTDHLWSITSRYYNEVSLHRKTSIREFVYMAFLLRHEAIDWKRFAELTDEFATHAACYYPLAFLNAIVPVVPEEAIAAIRPGPDRRSRDFGWQLGKVFDFIEPLPFDPTSSSIP